MTEALERLEGKIKRLLALVDRLESENRVFRSMAETDKENLSETEVVARIEGLKLEKEKLEKKLELAQRTLDRIISQIDNPEL
ncbi:MAG: hypothetical protein JXQ83_03645 [Candidatus Glassbacteria bacterium]|nr:hypothetical protein [Candidatus Glassbacteria bacterium]